MPVCITDVILAQRVLDQVHLVLNLEGVHLGNDHHFAKLAEEVLVVGQAERGVILILLVHLEVLVGLADHQWSNFLFNVRLFGFFDIVVAIILTGISFSFLINVVTITWGLLLIVLINITIHGLLVGVDGGGCLTISGGLLLGSPICGISGGISGGINGGLSDRLLLGCGGRLLLLLLICH